MINIKLSNSIDMPLLIYGVKEDTTEENILTALKFGYRCLYITDDSCCVKVGHAIANSGVVRSDLFLIGQLTASDYFSSQHRVLQTLGRLQTEYLDLMLLRGDDSDASWPALEAFYEEGILRAIGVIGFNDEKLSDLVEHHRIIPMISLCHQWSVQTHKRLHELAIVPILDGTFASLDHEPLIDELSEKYQKTPFQIVLRWHIQREIGAIFVCGCARHLLESREVTEFSLNSDEMNKIERMIEK